MNKNFSMIVAIAIFVAVLNELISTLLLTIFGIKEQCQSKNSIKSTMKKLEAEEKNLSIKRTVWFENGVKEDDEQEKSVKTISSVIKPKRSKNKKNSNLNK